MPADSRLVFSRRASVERAPHPFAQALARAKLSGRPLFDLTGSNPTQAEFSYPGQAILDALRQPRSLVYQPEPLGLLEARWVVAELWAARGQQVSPSRIMLTASTSDAYSYLLKLLCDAGDEILVPRPSYPLLEHLARLEGVRAVAYRLHYDGAWAIDLDHVRALVGPRTRGIVVVNPNNPTGNFLKTAELESLTALGLPLVSDEVFSSYPLRADAPCRADTVLGAADGLAFCLDGLSKLAALPQAKLAWVTASGRAPLVDNALGALEIIADTYLCAGTAVQLALPRLLSAQQQLRLTISERCRRNLDQAKRDCTESPVTVLHAEGGWYAVLRLPRLLSEQAWAERLLERQGVLVQPGWFYDFFDEPYLVLSLLTPEEPFRQGLLRIVTEAERVAQAGG